MRVGQRHVHRDEAGTGGESPRGQRFATGQKREPGEHAEHLEQGLELRASLLRILRERVNAFDAQGRWLQQRLSTQAGQALLEREGAIHDLLEVGDDEQEAGPPAHLLGQRSLAGAPRPEQMNDDGPVVGLDAAAGVDEGEHAGREILIDHDRARRRAGRNESRHGVEVRVEFDADPGGNR